MSTVTARLDALIEEARDNCENPNSQQAVRHEVLGMDLEIDIKTYLECLGLAAHIRSFLKKKPQYGESDSLVIGQLKLWPANLQDTISDINRARVFVPSRSEYIPLLPTEITSAETREAGNYLVAKGVECIRVGKQLQQLAKNNW
jgi:hypothetical protein